MVLAEVSPASFISNPDNPLDLSPETQITTYLQDWLDGIPGEKPDGFITNKFKIGPDHYMAATPECIDTDVVTVYIASHQEYKGNISLTGVEQTPTQHVISHFPVSDQKIPQGDSGIHQFKIEIPDKKTHRADHAAITLTIMDTNGDYTGRHIILEPKFSKDASLPKIDITHLWDDMAVQPDTDIYADSPTQHETSTQAIKFESKQGFIDLETALKTDKRPLGIKRREIQGNGYNFTLMYYSDGQTLRLGIKGQPDNSYDPIINQELETDKQTTIVTLNELLSKLSVADGVLYPPTTLDTQTHQNVSSVIQHLPSEPYMIDIFDEDNNPLLEDIILTPNPLTGIATIDIPNFQYSPDEKITDMSKGHSKTYQIRISSNHWFEDYIIDHQTEKYPTESSLQPHKYLSEVEKKITADMFAAKNKTS